MTALLCSSKERWWMAYELAVGVKLAKEKLPVMTKYSSGFEEYAMLETPLVFSKVAICFGVALAATATS